ncbi:MAG: lipocalin family protein [Gammaproteobacteria bacterium]|nr:lipocalin family protein [Gammaproteobacteria bacterium]
MKTIIPFILLILFSLTACSDMPKQPINIVDKVDLKRFMGDWYVIANIPTFIETEAHNAIESYELNEDGTIATTFTFYDGGFDGELKQYNPKGFVKDTESNAVWGMQFIWPIKADYRIIYLDEEYRVTIIGREKRDYVWIMARTPQIPAQEYQQLLSYLEEQGYDISQVRKVPQDWSK